MVALVKRYDGLPLTVHQTFLARDGSGKAPIERPRLFPSGASPLGGGAWFGRLTEGAEAVVSEGIESCLSALRLLNLEAGVAALSTRGIRSLILPEKARRIAIFADRDPGGEGLEAAWAAKRRWTIEDHVIRIEAPDATEDANDIWKRRAGL